MTVTLYKRQRQIVDFISQFIQRNGYSPTLSEIADAIGVSSLATIHEHLQALIKKNIIKKYEGAVRGIELIEKALPQNLPHEIKVSIESLKTFEDHILVKDLVLPLNVTALKNPDEIVASVLPPQKVEEELAAEITENVEDVAKVEKEKKEEEVVPEIKE